VGIRIGLKENIKLIVYSNLYIYVYTIQEAMAYMLYRMIQKDLAKKKEEKDKAPLEDAPKLDEQTMPFDKFANLKDLDKGLEPSKNENGDLVQTELFVDMVS
jgi:hypothetical protein